MLAQFINQVGTLYTAIVIGICVSMVAMGDEATKPKQKKVIVYVVGGTEYKTAVEAVITAAKNSDQRILRCTESSVEGVIGKKK